MIRRALVIGVVLFTAALLQTALFPAVPIFGFRPDLLLLLVVAVGLRDGPLAGLRVGLAAGLLTDLLIAQTPLGLAVLVHTGVGYVVGLARPYLAPDSITAPLAIAFVTGTLGTAGYGMLASLLADQQLSLHYLGQASLAVGLYNTLIAPIALGLVQRLTLRFPLRGALAE